MKIEDIADLAAVEPPRSKSKIKFGAKSRSGLTFVVTNTDRRKWHFRYRMPTSGRRSEVAIGDYPDMDHPTAERQARSLKALVQKGVDPAERSRQAKLASDRQMRNRSSLVPAKFSFANLIGEWLDHTAKRVSPSTLSFYRVGVNAHILPVFGAEDIRAIGFLECEKLILDKRGAGVSVPSRTLRTLRAFFAYCLEREVIAANPLAGRKELGRQVAIDPRKRFLSPRELHQFMNEIDDQPISVDVLYMLKIQLASGLRIGNVHSLCWSKIDAEAGVIVHERADMKARKGTRTAISETLLDILVEWQDKTPHTGDRLFDESLDTDRVAKLVHDNLSGWISFRTHDLRRTVSTTLQRLGCPREIRRRITNHEPPKTIDQHYDQEDQIEQQLYWLNRWGEALEALRLDPSALDPKDVDPERQRKLARLKPKSKQGGQQ